MKTVDTMDLAMRVKRRQITIKDVPEKFRAAVNRHLTRGEGKMVTRMRSDRAAAEGSRPFLPVRQRFVAG